MVIRGLLVPRILSWPKGATPICPFEIVFRVPTIPPPLRKKKGVGVGTHLRAGIGSPSLYCNSKVSNSIELLERSLAAPSTIY
jgi:hypothetical protein